MTEKPIIDRRDWSSPSRRKEYIGVMLAVENLKTLRDSDAPLEQIYQQIDAVHAQLDLIMTKRPPPQESASATCKDAPHEHTDAA